MVKIMNKNRSDIEDKFCKFEIKRLLEGDETISIISDTWSTDAVLASDSETIDANERNFATPLIPNNVILPGDYGLADPLISNFRVSNFDETQSESNWSTDVLGSDTEKPNEVEYDGSCKPLELPSPDSLFYDISSIKELETSCNFQTEDLDTVEKTSKFVRQPECLLNDNECIAEPFEISSNRKTPLSEELKSLDNDEIKELEENAEINIIRSDSNITNPFFNEGETLCDFTVQHRKNAAIQRNSDFDSRRNGISSKVVINSDLPNVKQPEGIVFDYINNAKLDAIITNAKCVRSSSGAIPKSISFDATADKNEQYSPNRKGGIFNKIKGFANMKGRRNRLNMDHQHINLSKNSENEEKGFLGETTDDILGKYRRKVSTSSDPASSESAGSNSSSKFFMLFLFINVVKKMQKKTSSFVGSLKSKSSKSDLMKTISSEPDFENIRRKIKMVLSRSSVPSTDFKSNCVSNTFN